MKTTILNKEVNEEIDWSKPQWVVGTEENLLDMVILTNGKHEDYEFQGVCLPCSKPYENGLFRKDFVKAYFQPIPKDGLTIHIQND
jgi:hypothetical protein